MSVQVNDSGTAKTPTIYINDGGTATEPTAIYVNDSGTAVQVYGGGSAGSMLDLSFAENAVNKVTILH